jgi:hypothetical protein
MIEVWMDNRLVSGGDCNIVNLRSPVNLQGMTNNVGLPFRVGDSIRQCTINIEEDKQNW